jgi:FkbM family methyltransferase
MSDDFLGSSRGKRQRWFGAKARIKQVMSWRLPHLVVRGASHLPWLQDRRQRLPAPAHLQQVTATMGGTSFVMLRPGRCVIAKELYWGEGRRPRRADQLALDVFAARARPADLILDVGAYTGIFSLLAAKVSSTSRVHAFEMIPAVAQLAIENVVANDLIGRITVHMHGIGRDGAVTRVPIGTGGSALPDFYSTKFKFKTGVLVPIRSLDSLFTSFDVDGHLPVTLMKIDVEGTEDEVLAEGDRFLAGTRPDILCEILPEANVGAVEKALLPHGYRFFTVTETGLMPRRDLVAHPYYRDWLFTRRTNQELGALAVPVKGCRGENSR